MLKHIETNANDCDLIFMTNDEFNPWITVELWILKRPLLMQTSSHDHSFFKPRRIEIPRVFKTVVNLLDNTWPMHQHSRYRT